MLRFRDDSSLVERLKEMEGQQSYNPNYILTRQKTVLEEYLKKDPPNSTLIEAINDKQSIEQSLFEQSFHIPRFLPRKFNPGSILKIYELEELISDHDDRSVEALYPNGLLSSQSPAVAGFYLGTLSYFLGEYTNGPDIPIFFAIAGALIGAGIRFWQISKSYNNLPEHNAKYLDLKIQEMKQEILNRK